MALSSGQRLGYAIWLVLAILLVGLHFAGNNNLIKLLEQDMSTITKILTSKEYILELLPIIRIVTSTKSQHLSSSLQVSPSLSASFSSLVSVLINSPQKQDILWPASILSSNSQLLLSLQLLHLKLLTGGIILKILILDSELQDLHNNVPFLLLRR